MHLLCLWLVGVLFKSRLPLPARFGFGTETHRIVQQRKPAGSPALVSWRYGPTRPSIHHVNGRGGLTMPRETVLAKHQPTAEPGLHFREYRRELEGNRGDLDISAGTRGSAFPTNNPRLLTLVTKVFPVPACVACLASRLARSASDG